jgi:hypothetical protein
MGNKRSNILLAFILLVSFNSFSQDSEENHWIKSFSFGAGVQPFASSWKYSHPFYSGSGGMYLETIHGTYKAVYFIQAGFELIKGHFGGGIQIGFKPSKITIEAPAVSYDFSANYFNLSAIYLPRKLTKTVSPVVVVQAGGVSCSGDISNPGFFISVGGGTRVTLSSHFGIDLNVSIQRLQFDDIPLESNISGDIHNYLLNGFAGLYYTF